MKLYYKLFYKIFTFNNSVATFYFLNNNLEKLYDQELLQIFQDWWRQFLENIDDRKKIVMAKKNEDALPTHVIINDVKYKFEYKGPEKGYKISKFKQPGSCYEIYGTDKDGKKVEIYYNPVDGSPMPKKKK